MDVEGEGETDKQKHRESQTDMEMERCRRQSSQWGIGQLVKQNMPYIPARLLIKHMLFPSVRGPQLPVTPKQSNEQNTLIIVVMQIKAKMLIRIILLSSNK